MEGVIKNALQVTLGELKEDELKRFRGTLSQTGMKEGRASIPSHLLEDADVPHTVELLKRYYSEVSAVEMTMQVLEEIQKKDLADQLWEKIETDFYPGYKEDVIKKCQMVLNYGSDVDGGVYLNTQYSNLIITERYRLKRLLETALLYEGQREMEALEELRTKETTSIDLKDLYSSGEKESSSKMVLLTGAYGIGKTLTAHKMILDWALGNLYQGVFHYVLYIDCIEVTQLKADVSVAELVFTGNPSLNLLQKKILKYPKKILLIIDGFEELQFSLDIAHPYKACNEYEKLPAVVAVGKLLRREVLSEACMIITSRCEALQKLDQFVSFNHCMEVFGFSEGDRHKYFQKYFGNEEQALNVFQQIRSNSIAFTMCYSPFICKAICMVVRERMKSSTELMEGLNCRTQVLLHYVNVTVQQHHPELREPVKSLFQKFGSLAFSGFKQQRRVFDKGDLQNVLLEASSALPSFLNSIKLKMDVEKDTIYTFAHPSLQEFFTALHCASCDDLSEVCNLLDGFNNYERIHQNSVLCFLFGLANAESARIIGWKASEKLYPKLLEWSKSRLHTHNCYSLLRFLYRLYEIQEDQFIKSSTQDCQEINVSHFNLNGVDWIVLGYCLQHYQQGTSLILQSCSMDVKQMQALLPVLKNASIKLLDMEHNTIGDEGVKMLCAALKNSDFEAEQLRLTSNKLTEACAADLSSVLRDNQLLKELNLSFNHLGDSGVKLLCAGLQEPDCKLEKLGLYQQNLTAACAEGLASVLHANRTLKELLLGYNDLRDLGVKQLCAALRVSPCKLETLIRCRKRESCGFSKENYT
ncbi:NACHT, LRR and PYD domains-containing protein 3 isoform X2 [Latimeria chalumnae]|uniref:NACHT, LRR and PYD domains-containing protein 3 isoform X2 n=1 Tax=Latimeria chalumnae TaxID=7897 RepID=UPI0003C15874|nr:PREDICTED: NACHT, LRR and PYD domains-containing protein 3-like isoform X2 [Latimeria chalumnae]|eukprot:XP_014352178.1 PREDICTED: NACHT, LRR and PYD domains-containing protein 3-like isoform X2 [Latimeria chalumnae]